MGNNNNSKIINDTDVNLSQANSKQGDAEKKEKPKQDEKKKKPQNLNAIEADNGYGCYYSVEEDTSDNDDQEERNISLEERFEREEDDFDNSSDESGDNESCKNVGLFLCNKGNSSSSNFFAKVDPTFRSCTSLNEIKYKETGRKNRKVKREKFASTSSLTEYTDECYESEVDMKRRIQGKNSKSKRRRNRKQRSELILLPSAKSPFGSFSKLYEENNVNFTQEELMMPDGDVPTHESDLRPSIQSLDSEHKNIILKQKVKCRTFHVVTTASLPWMTGTALNPLLRAIYLHKMNRSFVERAMSSQSNRTNNLSQYDMGSVTLVIPWLIDKKDQEIVYGKDYVFDNQEDQETYIRSWIRNTAKLPIQANPKTGIKISYYPAVYSKQLLSIFPIGDICNLISDDDADICILEEPEHINLTRPTHLRMPWSRKFRYVVGIIHTNYKAYARAHPSGVVSSFLISLANSMVVRAHCHRIVKLSATLQSFAHEKEVVSNTHGIRSDFLEEGKKRSNDYKSKIMLGLDKSCLTPEGGNKIYYIGKLLWAKGLDHIINLQYVFKKKTGSYFDIDIYGSGPEEDEIKRAFRGWNWNKKNKSNSTISLDRSIGPDNDIAQSINRIKIPNEVVVNKVDMLMKDLPRSTYEFRPDPIPAKFFGKKDHSLLKSEYKIFVNPSTTEVLCTTTSEALAMGKFVIIPQHPSNIFFEQFPNSLMYNSKQQFVVKLKYAVENDPTPLTPDQSYQLSWEAATERLIKASITTQREACRRERLGQAQTDERVLKFVEKCMSGPVGVAIRGALVGHIVEETDMKKSGIEKELLQL